MAIIKNPLTVISGGGDLNAWLEGSTTNLNSDITSIKKYANYQNTTLTTLDLPEALSIGEYAFYENTGLTTVDISKCSSIGQKAFLGCSNATITIDFSNFSTFPSYPFQNVTVVDKDGGTAIEFNNASLGERAFEGTKLANAVDEIKGTINGLGTYALNISTGSNIKKIHLSINGSVGTTPFGDNTFSYVNDVDISNSIITSLASIGRIGSSRPNQSTNILEFDFRNSTFAIVSGYCFGSTGSGGQYYSRVLLPSSITQLQPASFYRMFNCTFYFSSATPPRIETSSWQGSSDYKIFVPYNSFNAYRTATNWTTYTSYMYGYAPANTFNQGDTLPTLNTELYGLTWYSDEAMTTQITTVADPTQILYCTVGATQLAYYVEKIMAKECSIIISDGTNTYSQGDYIMAGTTVTITGVPSVSGYIPYLFTVDGTNFTSGNTYIVNSGLTIKALYYDGVNLPYSTTLANNTWASIKEASQFGVASSLWSVGDIKTLVGADNNTYTFRIVDMQDGRYKYVDSGDPTHITFEMVETSALTYRISTSNYTIYTYSSMNTSVLPSYLNDILTDLVSVLDNIYIRSKSSYSSSDTGYYNVSTKLFLRSLSEGYVSQTGAGYVGERVSTYNGTQMNAFDYYATATETDNAERRKKVPMGYSTVNSYWSRTTYDYRYWWYTSTSGGSTYMQFTSSNFIAPCFAL